MSGILHAGVQGAHEVACCVTLRILIYVVCKEAVLFAFASVVVVEKKRVQRKLEKLL
jgi:hypothetical protein